VKPPGSGFVSSIMSHNPTVDPIANPRHFPMFVSATMFRLLRVSAALLLPPWLVACTSKPKVAQATQPSTTASSPMPTTNTPPTTPSRPPPLTPDEQRIIVGKGTEPPFSGKYVNHKADGTYACRRCGSPLFNSDAKFDSRSGWPSFDDALPGAVKEVEDADGMRTEIVCAHCGAHLGHVFRNEGFTAKNTRHCVNSASLSFSAERASERTTAAKQSGVAYFAGGCFWGVEYYFEKLPGVIEATSGYMGGHREHPTYEEVSSKRTGHAETVKVSYDSSRVTYRDLAKLFFEIHDPTQAGRQGPDVGSQYRSAVFVSSEAERKIVEDLIAKLKARGFAVVTEVHQAGRFWNAESYHQDYYGKTGKQPYCHARVERFGT